MGDELIGVLVLVGLAILSVPSLALLMLLSMRARLRALEESVRQLTRNDQAQRSQIAELLQRRPVETEPERAPARPEPGAVTPEPTLAPILSLVRRSPPAGELAPTVAPGVPPAAAQAPPATPANVERPPPPTPPRQAPLEERIAYWFTRAGAAAFLLGIAYFFKYAVDNDWIGPTGRILLGAFVGAAILAISELLWQRALTTYTRVVEGVGLCVLMATTYSSFALYHLVSVPVAFFAVGIVALLGGALAAHHRSEPILLLSLLGALLAPVILSTGQDNPLGLFSYVLLVGSLANWVALRERFALTPALSIVGSVVLFAGWYFDFFRIGLEPVARSYVEVRSRAVPLISVASFSASWIVLAWAARRRGHENLRPVWLELAGLVFAHGGAAMLLFDHAPLLGGAFVGLAAVSAIVLRQEDRRELLIVPLLVSFAILLWLGHGIENAVAVPTFVVLAVWTSVYAAAFLRGRVGTGIVLPARSALLAAVSVAAFGVFGALLLFDAHPFAFGALLAALSVPLVALAELASLPLLLGAAAVASFGGLCALADARTTPLLLPITGSWALVYFASGAWDLLRRKAPPTPVRLAVISGAGLGFVGLVLQQTSTADSLLRAALFGLVGGGDLLLGIALLREKERRPASNVFLAQALALFFVAVALLLSGVSITIAWAAMATTCAVLAAREKDRDWVSGSVALFAVTLGRLVSIDWHIPAQGRLLFLISQGSQGQLTQHFLLNPRALALVVVAAGLAVAGWSLSKLEDVNLRIAAAVYVSLAHAVALALILTEARSLYLKLPAPPHPPLEPGGWEAFQSALLSSLQEQANAISVLMTILLGIYSLALLGAGFGLRDALHRYLGLGLFGLTLGKLGLWDIWQLPRTYQIATLVGVGALLLVASFLYANRRSALASLWKGGVGLLLFVSLGRTARAEVLLPEFSQLAPIDGVKAPGLYVARIGPALWRASSNNLSDLRVLDSAGLEVPFFLRTPPAYVQHPEDPTAVRMVDPVTLPQGGFQATFVQGPKPLPNDGLVLTVDGGNFLRTVRVESSTNGRTFGVLEQGPLVYRVSGARDQLTVRYPESEARYLRLTLLPRGDGQEVRITGGSLLVVNPHAPVRGAPPELLLDLVAGPHTQDKQAHVSHFEFDAGEPGVPLNELRLRVTTPAYERRATVLALSGQEWVPVGSGVLFRADDEHGNRSENTRLPIQTNRGHLRLDIDDGDDPPLVIEGAQARAVSREIMFRAEKTGRMQLFVGNATAAPPRYDLRDVFDRMPNATLTEAFLGAPVPNPAHPVAAVPAPPQVSWTDQHKTLVGIILGALLLALAGWTALLLRKSGQPTE